MSLTREVKLGALKIKNYDGPEEYVDSLYKQYILDKQERRKMRVRKQKDPNPNFKEESKSEEEKEPIDKTTIKYKLLLEYVNKILKNVDAEKYKDDIDDLTDFKNIDRNQIVSEENTKIFEDMTEVFCEVFNKDKCGFYRNKNSPNKALNCLRGMVKEIGHEFPRKKYNVSKDKYFRSAYCYSII